MATPSNTRSGIIMIAAKAPHLREEIKSDSRKVSVKSQFPKHEAYRGVQQGQHELFLPQHLRESDPVSKGICITGRTGWEATVSNYHASLPTLSSANPPISSNCKEKHIPPFIDHVSRSKLRNCTFFILLQAGAVQSWPSGSIHQQS